MNSPLFGILPFLLILLVFYFFLLRPQQQRLKAHQDMVDSLRRNDVVVTAGGLVARITKVKDNHEVEAEIAEGVRVRLVRGTISEVRNKGETGSDE